MATIDTLSDALSARDATEKHLLPYFAAFSDASQRAVRAEQLAATSTPNTPNDTELVNRLETSRFDLERRVNLLQSQLDAAQERARATSEEQYLKTHAVQGLHDEILSLTMQLNLSEEKRKKLQDDLGR